MMSAIPAESILEKPNAYWGILWGGLLAGILDITAACINGGLSSGRSPLWILQSVASGWLGADSYKGGMASGALGLVTHFFIAFTATAVYFLASRKLNFLVQQALISGVLYGIAVYMFMYMLVIPVTFSRKFSAPVSAIITPVLIHIFCVGLPIALMVKRFSATSPGNE
jgi:hypothetical protein